MIHPTAIIDPSARLDASVKVGPYCVIGAEVEIAAGCELLSHVVVHGPTQIGARARIFPFSAIGLEPQDISFKPTDRTSLIIGERCLIRENVTISRGTVKGGGVTRLGNDVFVMAYAHIGHDCVVGDHVMMVNAATLGGHVTVEDWAVIGAFGPVHQFVRVGAHSYIGGGTIVTQDVLPFTKTVARRENATFGVNAIGLERRGFTKERIAAIQKAYKIFKHHNNTQAIEKLKSELAESEDAQMLARFLEQSERGVIK